MEQITLNYEQGLVESFPTCREYLAHRVHHQGVPQKAIAADMDYSPSHLSRKCSQSPDDSMRMTLDDLEKFIQVTGDSSPVLYLVEKYLATNTTRLQELEAELARLRRLKGAA